MNSVKNALVVIVFLIIAWQAYARVVEVWNLPVSGMGFYLSLRNDTSHRVTIKQVSLDGNALDLKGREVLSPPGKSVPIMESEVHVDGISHHPREILKVTYRIEGTDEDHVASGEVRVHHMTLPSCELPIRDQTKLECIDLSP